MSDQFIRCKVCDEKVTEGEQASIVHDKCMVSHKDHEEIKEECKGQEHESIRYQELYEEVDSMLGQVQEKIEGLSRKPLKPELEKLVKDLKEILEGYEG